jgi:hypothetical protein
VSELARDPGEVAIPWTKVGEFADVVTWAGFDWAEC